MPPQAGLALVRGHRPCWQGASVPQLTRACAIEHLVLPPLLRVAAEGGSVDLPAGSGFLHSLSGVELSRSQSTKQLLLDLLHASLTGGCGAGQGWRWAGRRMHYAAAAGPTLGLVPASIHRMLTGCICPPDLLMQPHRNVARSWRRPPGEAGWQQYARGMCWTSAHREPESLLTTAAACALLLWCAASVAAA